MKVLHINTWDIEGGAARGAYWMHSGLRKAGIDSYMLSLYKYSSDPTVIGIDRPRLRDRLLREIRIYIEELALKKYPNRKPDIFSPARISENITELVNKINPDIINLHWVGYGFLNPEAIAKLNKPIVWTLRDMWSFTGGCHYAGECTRYQQTCGSCPHLASQQDRDITRKLWQRKAKAWKNIDMTVVALSPWLANCARQSSLFQNRRIEVIQNSIDLSLFKPKPKSSVRELLDLPKDRNIILFGAIDATSDRRKGFQYLVSALQKLASSKLGQNSELVVFGASESQSDVNFDMKANYLGYIRDDRLLALIYAAADVTVVPSLQEAFGKTALESLACGTPVVSFDSTGLKEIVEHQCNGYRASCLSSDDLANGIAWVLKDNQRWQYLSQNAQKTVEQKFTMTMQSRSYIELYKDILAQ